VSVIPPAEATRRSAPIQRRLATDQAELHGLLAKVRDLGATLISVKSTDARTRLLTVAGHSWPV
jgi:hypothetical protein